MTSGRGAGVIAAFGVAWAALGGGWAAETPGGAAVIQGDGSVVAGTGSHAWNPEPGAEHPAIVYRFGLPAGPAERRWREDDRLPIFHSEWEQDGIRYRQSVLLTRLGAGDLDGLEAGGSNAVLIVHLVGENVSQVYTEARAGLAVEVGGRRLDLELKGDVTRAVDRGREILVGSIDISPSGLVNTNGSELRFRGNMPPGTSGSMTVKLTSWSLRGEGVFARLSDMVFDEEVRRIKRAWGSRVEAGSGTAQAIRFADSADAEHARPAPDRAVGRP